MRKEPEGDAFEVRREGEVFAESSGLGLVKRIPISKARGRTKAPWENREGWCAPARGDRAESWSWGRSGRALRSPKDFS